MMKRKSIAILLTVALCMVLIAGCSGAASSAAPAQSAPAPSESAQAPQAPAFKPTKTIELLVPNSAGGGTDIFARTIEKIARENKFIDVPINVVNKPGGSTSVCFGYMLTKKGDDHTIACASTTFWTTPLSGTAPYNYTDFTPLGEMSVDNLVLAMDPNLGLKTIEDVIAYAKAHPGDLSFSGSSLISEGSMLTYALSEASGCEFKPVPFDSGGDAMTAVLGGHISGTWTNPVEAKAHFDSGALIPVAAATETRIADYPNLPTLKEKGYDVSIVQHRIIVGVPGMSQEAIDFYSDLLKKVYETPEFKEYLTSNSLTPSLVVGADFAKLSDKVGETYRPLIEKILADQAK